jgi:type IV pilus assembly protein PilC
MLLEAGITLHGSLQIMQDDEQSRDGKEMMNVLIDALGRGESFSTAIERSALFPRYMVHMVEIGEKTGRLVQTLTALSEHYNRQERLAVTIKSSVMYPAILLILMIVVVLILIVQVLPIFSDVFGRLGSHMSPLAVSLMNFGSWLGDAAIVIAIVLGVIFAVAFLAWCIRAVRVALKKAFMNRWGGRGIFDHIATSRFTSAMSLAMASGLDTSESTDIAFAISGGSKAVDMKHKKCTELLDSGITLAEALTKADILSSQDGKMLSIGSHGGKADEAMAEIARRGDINVRDEIDRIVGKIEPTLVIISSVVIGIILLSVMLPLMGIMTSIG